MTRARLRWRLLLPLLAASCSAPWSRFTVPRPELAQDVAVTLPLYQERTLNNGLTVWLSSQPDAQLAAAAVALRRPPLDAGIKSAALQLTYDLLTDGTAYRDDLALDQAFAQLGARCRGMRLGAGAVIGATVLPQRLPALLEVLAEMARAPLTNEAVFEARRRERTLRDGSERDGPDGAGWRVLGRELGLPDFELSAADFAAVTPAQWRTSQAALLDPRSAAVVVTGGFDEASILSAIEGFFGQWRAGRARPAAAAAPAGPGHGRMVLVPWPKLKQTHLLIGNRLPRLDAAGEAAVRAAMSHYLGLLNRFRLETGASYGPLSGIQLGAEAGFFSIEVTVDARITRPAMRDALGGLEALLAWTPNTRELTNLRELLSQTGAAGSEDSGGHNWTAAAQFVRGQERDRAARVARAVATLTPNEIRRAIVDHFAFDSVSLVVVGDPEVAQAAADAVGIRLQAPPPPSRPL